MPPSLPTPYGGAAKGKPGSSLQTAFPATPALGQSLGAMPSSFKVPILLPPDPAQPLDRQAGGSPAFSPADSLSDTHMRKHVPGVVTGSEGSRGRRPTCTGALSGTSPDAVGLCFLGNLPDCGRGAHPLPAATGTRGNYHINLGDKGELVVEQGRRGRQG